MARATPRQLVAEVLEGRVQGIARLISKAEAGDEDGHHLALIARATSPHLGDHLARCLSYLFAAHLSGQVGLEHLQLSSLFLHQVATVSLLERSDALPALLRLPADNGQNIRFAQGRAPLYLGVLVRQLPKTPSFVGR